MTTSVFHIAARRILCLALVLAPVLATHPSQAQNNPPPYWATHQSPIVITPPIPLRDPRKFTATGSLQVPANYYLVNTFGKPWCDKESGQKCDGTTDQHWGSLKVYPDAAGAQSVAFNGARYTLKEFHFHHRAEHIDGKILHAMEAHFVFHRDGAASCSPGEYLVIGQWIDSGAENEQLELIFGDKVNLPPHYLPGNHSFHVSGLTIGKVLAGFPDGTMSYRYDGSLTAPANVLDCRPETPPTGPDTPNQLGSRQLPGVVTWVMLTKPITMSPQQIDRFVKLFPDNARHWEHASPEQVVREGEDSVSK
jgi:carbonic anhydrase